MFFLLFPYYADTCFTQDQKCEDKIINELRTARRTIHIQCYNFNLRKLAGTLWLLAEDGVQIRIIADKSHEDNKSILNLLKHKNIEVSIDYKPTIMHLKIIILDAGTPNEEVITGSYNYTKEAENLNSENVVFIKGHRVISEYMKNWQDRRGQSRDYTYSY